MKKIILTVLLMLVNLKADFELQNIYKPFELTNAIILYNH